MCHYMPRSACQLKIKLTQSFFVVLDPHFSQDGNVFQFQMNLLNAGSLLISTLLDQYSISKFLFKFISHQNYGPKNSNNIDQPQLENCLLLSRIFSSKSISAIFGVISFFILLWRSKWLSKRISIRINFFCSFAYKFYNRESKEVSCFFLKQKKSQCLWSFAKQSRLSLGIQSLRQV